MKSWKKSLFRQSATYRLRSVLIKGTVGRRERGAEKPFNINLLQLHIFYGREWVSLQFKINSKLRMSYLEFFCCHLCLRYFATLFRIWGLGWTGFVCNFHLMCISYIVFSRVNWLVENGKDRYLQTSEMSKTMSPVVTDQVLSSKMGGHQTLTSPHLWRKIVKRFPPGKSCHSFDSPHDLTTYRKSVTTSSQKNFFNMWSVFFHFWAASVFPHLTDWLVMVG